MEHLEGWPAALATLHVASRMSNKDIPHSNSRGQASATPCGGPPSMAGMAYSQWIWLGDKPCMGVLVPRVINKHFGTGGTTQSRRRISSHAPHGEFDDAGEDLDRDFL